jgi:hypothetical protein
MKSKTKKKSFFNPPPFCWFINPPPSCWVTFYKWYYFNESCIYILPHRISVLFSLASRYLTSAMLVFLVFGTTKHRNGTVRVFSRVKLCREHPLIRLRRSRHMDMMTLDLWSLKRKRNSGKQVKVLGGSSQKQLETVFVFWMFPRRAMRPSSKSTLVRDLPFWTEKLKSEIRLSTVNSRETGHSQSRSKHEKWNVMFTVEYIL